MAERQRLPGWGCLLAVVLALATGALLIAAVVARPDRERVEVTPAQRALVVCANLRSATQRVTDTEPTTAGRVVELLAARSLPTSLWRELDDDHFVALCELADDEGTATYAADDEGRAQRVSRT